MGEFKCREKLKWMELLNCFMLQDLSHSMHLKQKGKSLFKRSEKTSENAKNYISFLRERILQNWAPHHGEYYKAEKLDKSIENVWRAWKNRLWKRLFTTLVVNETFLKSVFYKADSQRSILWHWKVSNSKLQNRKYSDKDKNWCMDQQG